MNITVFSIHFGDWKLNVWIGFSLLGIYTHFTWLLKYNWIICETGSGKTKHLCGSFSLFFFSLSFLTFLLFSFPCYFPLSLPLPLLLFIYFFAYFQRGINSVSYLHCFLKRKKCLKKLFFITDNFFPRWFDYPCLISTVN